MSGVGGRPRGELRGQLVQVFSQTSEALTWREAAARLVADGHAASVGEAELQAIRRTVANMAAVGELQRAGRKRHRGNRPMTTFRARPAVDPAAVDPAAPVAPWVLLSDAMRPESTK